MTASGQNRASLSVNKDTARTLIGKTKIPPSCLMINVHLPYIPETSSFIHGPTVLRAPFIRLIGLHVNKAYPFRLFLAIGLL